MQTTVSQGNHNLNSQTSSQSVIAQTAQIYPKILHLETILARLNQRDDEIFRRIVEAVKINDNFLSMMLASELTKIRILERNLRVTLELFYYVKK